MWVCFGGYLSNLEPTDSQNEERKRVPCHLCSPPTGKAGLLQAAQNHMAVVCAGRSPLKNIPHLPGDIGEGAREAGEAGVDRRETLVFQGADTETSLFTVEPLEGLGSSWDPGPGLGLLGASRFQQRSKIQLDFSALLQSYMYCAGLLNAVCWW